MFNNSIIVLSSSSSYFLHKDYKRIIFISTVALALLSGLLFPREEFPVSPPVPSLAQLVQAASPLPRTPSSPPAEYKHIKQIAVVAIGQEKLQPTPTPVVLAATQTTTQNWGVAKQIDEHTWTMQVGTDDRMATPLEIFSALNDYRQKKGKHTLSWDSGLASYASTRAQTFTSLGTTDKHEGFLQLVNNENGFSKLGFNSLGENSSFGYTLLGVHLIEWVYAADKPHDDNQLSDSWTHVGIGVNGTSTDLVFGGSKR